MAKSIRCAGKHYTVLINQKLKKYRRKMKIKFCTQCGNLLDDQSVGSKIRFYCRQCHHTQYRNPIVGVAVLIVKERQVLMVKRIGSYAGAWCIPCGYVEWNEDVRKAAGRELKEETGLDAEIGSVFAVHSNFHDPENQTVGIWFWGETVGGHLAAGSDADETGYFSVDQLPKSMAFPTDILVCQQLKDYLDSGHR
jgi:ADP-ribose pyrophosphatase YjhB (NUDIX family)